MDLKKSKDVSQKQTTANTTIWKRNSSHSNKIIHHYNSFRKMLETEGVQNVLSSEPKTIDHGIHSFNSLTGYEKNVQKYGIFAIGIKRI